MVKEITDGNYKTDVLASNQIVLLDFWAPNCGPCMAIAPIIEELSEEYEGRAIIGKVDIDKNQEIAMEYSIRSIPTIMIIKNGKVMERHLGTATKARLRKKLEKHLS